MPERRGSVDQACATVVSYFGICLIQPTSDLPARDYTRALYNAKNQIRNQEKMGQPILLEQSSAHRPTVTANPANQLVVSFMSRPGNGQLL